MQRTWSAWIVLIGLVASVALTACGNGPSRTTVGAAETATATPATPTAAATTTTTTTTTAKATAPCPANQPAVTSGDLTISTPSLSLGYPYYKLPDGVALNAPQQVSGNKPANPLPTNPSMVTGFTFIICNTSTTRTHTLASMKLRVDAFSAYSGTVDQWTFCDGPYDTATKNVSGGCGGGAALDVQVAATMPNTVTSGMILNTGNTNPSLPLGSFPPGTSLFVAVGVSNTLPSGTYTFSIGLAVDGATPLFVPSGEKPTLFAPVAHNWTGEACMNKPDMMAQIPPSTDHHDYVCPQI